ncbi:MAG TPA: hypothetical protein VHX88_08530 [Solirubrobacteraceae bacterium]|nr:hypothetical protein [Solirubrobacteraceae bacterium]
MNVEPGLHRDREFVVEQRLLTDVGGTLAAPVFATPSMIGVMEAACARLVYAHLPPGHATVGFEVCVRHVARAQEGTRCRVSATLREVLDGRTPSGAGTKLRFDVRVEALDSEPPRVIGLGTHERRVVDVAVHSTSPV